MSKRKKRKNTYMDNAKSITSVGFSSSSNDLHEQLVFEELEFLKNKLADEDRRRDVIEGKTGQLLGQVSIVISIVALFVPLISDQINDFPLWERVSFITLFLIVVIAFIVSIWIASSSWIINRYGYLRPDFGDIYECGKPESRTIFMERYSSLLTEAIPQHININNGKGTKLIRAGIAFRFGTILLGVFVVSLSVALSISKAKPKEVIIQGPIKVIDFSGRAS